jgi:hypothetical protein
METSAEAKLDAFMKMQQEREEKHPETTLWSRYISDVVGEYLPASPEATRAVSLPILKFLLDYGNNVYPHYDISEMVDTIKSLRRDGFFDRYPDVMETIEYLLKQEREKRAKEKENEDDDYKRTWKYWTVGSRDEDDEDEEDDEIYGLFQALFDERSIGDLGDYEKNKERYSLVDDIIFKHFSDADPGTIEEAIQDCEASLKKLVENEKKQRHRYVGKSANAKRF